MRNFLGLFLSLFLPLTAEAYLSPLISGDTVIYNPASVANWAVDPTSAGSALDNIAAAKMVNLWYVSKSFGVNSASCGAQLNPCSTISQALTNMGAAASAADVKKAQTVMIEGGAYDESLTIPDGRIINLIALGTVVLGDGAGSNWASTTPRNVNFSPTNSGVFSSDIKPALTIGAINPGDATSTFLAEANGFFISGDLQLNGSGVSHTLNLFGVKLAGAMTKTSTGLTNIQAYRSYFVGALNLSAGSTILERIEECQFDALVTVDSYNYILNSEIKAGMTTVTGLVNTLPPNGMYHTTFTGTFTGPASSLKLDLASDFFFRANSASLAGGATKVIVSPVATSAITGVLSSTDWSTFNNKEPAITSGTTSQYWRGDKSFQQVQFSELGGAATSAQLPAPAAASISALDIDWSTLLKTGGIYSKTLATNSTFTFSNVPAAGCIEVWLKNTASNYTVTWPASVKWPAATAPTQTVGDKTDRYSLCTKDGSVVAGGFIQDYTGL